MKTKLTLCALLLACAPAWAGTLGLHLGSWHSEPGYNNVNPGLYYRADSGFTAGFYRNSIRKDSAYAGWTWKIAGPLQLTAGAITGYHKPVLPLVAPSLVLDLGKSAALRVVYLPKVEATGSHVVHFALEFKL